MNTIHIDFARMIAKRWEIEEKDVPEVLVKWCVFEQCYDPYGIRLAISAQNMTFWSDSPEFCRRFYIFAECLFWDELAIWDDGSGKPLSEMPIVVLGDDGYLGIIAENLNALLQMLAGADYLDMARKDYEFVGGECVRVVTRPLVWIPFEEDALPPNLPAFIEFLQDLHLIPDSSPDESLLEAYRQYTPRFIQWCNQYLKDGLTWRE